MLKSSLPLGERVELICKGDWSLGSACQTCRRCQETAPTEIARLRDELRMYKEAWARELGGLLYPKRHFIDALVKTTKIMREELAVYKEKEKIDRAREIRENTFGYEASWYA